MTRAIRPGPDGGSAARTVASWLYGSAAWAHRGIGGFLRQRRAPLPCRVLSVGGMTLGGAGKTPVAAHLAAALAARGARVVLASRGYGGRAREPVTLVSDGRAIHADVERAGDEALLLASHAPGVPVLVGRDRRTVGHHAVKAFGAEILVLDDGFQHHRLPRDLDWVCLDAAAPRVERRVVPRGPLREPWSSLRHADWLCLVDAGEAEWVRQLELEFRAGRRPVVHARRRPSGLRPLAGGAAQPPETLSGREVGMLCGLGQPDSLRRSLAGLGAEIVAERIFPDHHRYRRADLHGLDREAPHWVTTEKDALKILPAWTPPDSVSVLGIEIALEDEPAVLDGLWRALHGERVLRRHPLPRFRADSGPD